MALTSGSKGNGPHDAEFAIGGMQTPRAKDFKKEDPQGRGLYGKFLGTKDRFTNMPQDSRVAGARASQATAEDWSKPKGVGHTEADDHGDTKSLKPIKPRS